jgi:hypothetical protein
MRASRLLGVVVATVAVCAALSGCGGGDNDGNGTGGSSGADLPPVIIEITESGGHITPDDGRVVKVTVGQEVQLNVSSDVADEIHVHSEPEHEYEVAAGEDASFSFTIDSPGVYPIESHGLEITLVKLQVS